MKKLMIAAALLALVLVAAAPAIAQVNNAAGGDEAASGDVTTPFSANQTGNNSSQCVTAEQFGNTGNNQNSQGDLQYASQQTGAFSGIEFEGGGFTFTPANTQTCTQQVQQSSAASG